MTGKTTFEWALASKRDKIAAVARVYKLGMSAHDIAVAAGATSRSAVIGLYGRTPWLRLNYPLNSATGHLKRHERNGTKPPPPKAKPLIPAKQVGKEVALVRPDFKGSTLVELPADGCKYPEGTDFITFCAQPRKEGSPYCAHHHDRCYTGVKALARKNK